MKKQTAILVWSAILLLIIVGCVAMYVVPGRSSEGYTPKSQEVFTCVSTDIRAYTVIDKNGEYTIEKKDRDWVIKNDPKAELDGTKVSKLLASASKITAIGTVGEKALKNFDTSVSDTVTIDIAGKPAAQLKFIGRLNDICAFTVSGDDKVYAMYAATRDILLPKVDSLRITVVFPHLTQKDSLPDYYCYTDYDGSVTEVRVKTNSEFAKSKDNRYIMEKPYIREVDDDLFEQQIAVKIPAMEISAFEPQPIKSLQVYGLDEKSRATMKISWDGIDETLYLGIAKDGLVYAAKADLESVFTISSSQLEFLNLDPFYILESGILKSDVEHIRSVTVKNGEDVYTVTTEYKDGKKSQFSVNGKAASEDVFDEIMETLGDISFMQELGTAPQNTEDIVLTVVYDNAAASQTISLAKNGEKAFAVFMDGNAEFAVSKADVDELLKILKYASKDPIRVD